MIRLVVFAAVTLVAQHGVRAQTVPIGQVATATLHIPGGADFLALDGRQAWVTNRGRVERLSPNAPAPTVTIALAEPCGAMVVAFGSLWVAECHQQALVRIGLRSLTVEATIPTGLADPEGELSLASGAGAIWVLTDSMGVLARIDPSTNSVTAHIQVAPHSYAAAFGYGAVWITATTSPGLVQRIDPTRNQVAATIPVGPYPRFLAVGDGSVWTLDQGDGTVSRIDPTTNRLAATVQAEVPGSGGDIATGGGRVWVRATRTLLSVIDPGTNQITRRYGPPAGSGAVRVGYGQAWVTAHDIQTVWVLPAAR